MNKDRFDLDIRTSKKEELDILEKAFSPNSYSKYHYKRHEVQERGKGVYLIAWHHEIPVGHFLLRWSALEKDISYGFPRDVAYLEAGGTRAEFQRRGVATKIIETAENLSKEKGFQKIGLAVGRTDNPNARKLYEKLRYKDWGGGEVTVSWEYVDKDGNTGTEVETCIYMLKNL